MCPLLCLVPVLVMLPPLSCGFSLNVAHLVSCACSRNVPPLSCGFSLNIAPILYLVPVLVICPPCLASFLIIPFFVLWLFSYCAPFFVLKATVLVNVAPLNMFVLWLISLCFPLLCLAAFLLMLPPVPVLVICPPFKFVLWLFSLLLPPCLSCRCSILPLSLSCGFSLNVAPFFCLVAVLLMLPPFFSSRSVPPLSCGFSLNVVVFGYLVMLWPP